MCYAVQSLQDLAASKSLEAIFPAEELRQLELNLKSGRLSMIGFYELLRSKRVPIIAIHKIISTVQFINISTGTNLIISMYYQGSTYVFTCHLLPRDKYSKRRGEDHWIILHINVRSINGSITIFPRQQRDKPELLMLKVSTLHSAFMDTFNDMLENSDDFEPFLRRFAVCVKDKFQIHLPQTPKMGQRYAGVGGL